MNKKVIIREQLDNKIIKLGTLQEMVLPPSGWIYAIRQGINMSLRQLGERLNITPQSVKEIEEREKNGTISIKVLRQVASALNMKFVYGFIPAEQTLEKMVEKRAEELARTIVYRTSNQMALEDQKNSPGRIEQSVQERTILLKNEMPRTLWD